MALASAALLGIELPRNFNAPLRSLSIIEYWQRWHISLSNFITTYLYTPIICSFERVTLATAGAATILAMAITGLWHGPSWNFVIFGTIHGVALVINQYWRKKKMPRLPAWASWLVTMGLVDLGFIFFRSPDLATAGLFLQHIFVPHHLLGYKQILQMNGQGVMVPIFYLTQIVGIGTALVGKSSDEIVAEFKPTWRGAIAVAACLLLGLFYMNSNVAKPFVYFGF